MFKSVHQLARLCGLALFVLTVLPAPVSAESDEAEIRSIIEAIRVGWVEADGTPFRTHFLDFEGARYFESGGQNVGLDDLVNHHVVPEADAFDGFELKIDNLEVHVEGDFAWVLTDNEIKAKVKRDGRVIHNKGHGTYLLRKVDGKWKVVHSHSSSRPVKKEKQHKH